MIALANQYDLQLEQFDVTGAYLHGELEEEVYMGIPDGMAVDPKLGNALRLDKGLYGLKQGARQWNLKFVEIIDQFNFKPLRTDICLFVHRDPDQFALILLYVDDILIASKSKDLVDRVKKGLSEKILIKSLGAISHF